jgi:hypothetical protein
MHSKQTQPEERRTNMAHQGEPTPQRDKVITRMALARQIEARLAGKLDDAALAAWAFDRFYAEELGMEVYESGAEEAIADTLDALIFDDDPSFRLDEAELRALLARLGML